MKIGFVVPGGLDRSGRERIVPALVWLLERLARRHDVHAFVLDYYPEPCTYQLRGAAVHDLGRVAGPPGLRRSAMTRRLDAAIREWGPFDVLHAYWGMPAGVATTIVARRAGVPAIVTFSSGELVRIDDIAYGLQRRWFDRQAIARVLREAAAITVPTSYMASFPALDGVKPTIVPVGIDTAACDARSQSRGDGPPWHLVRVGSINAVKDHRTLLHAVAALPADVRAQVRLDIVGEDTLGGAMQTLAGQLGIGELVAFHGWQPTERVLDIFAGAHLHVVSSRHEASSVTMLEAACLGVPTVGTAVGYVADWQPDRAVAVPVNDPPALAHAIQTLLQDPERRMRIAEAARAWTLAHDVDWTARAFERVYEEAVTRR